MKTRPLILILCGVAALLATWLLWPRGETNSAPATGKTSAGAAGAAGAAKAAIAENAGKLSAAATNRLALRLANTTKKIGELSRMPHAVLLENAFVDTEKKIDFSIPKNLQLAGDPGAWIVQARGTVDAAFRAALTSAGAKEISYIPNNALLVRAAAGAAESLRGSPLVQAVLPYEPYYKVQPSLLTKAVAGKDLPIGQVLTLGLFADGAEQTLAAIEKMGGVVLAQDRGAFGPVVRVNPPADWTALARLPGVARMEPAVRRKLANDLTRAIMGVATDSVTTTNYLNLSGSNVVVEVNDTGVDATHPDLLSGGGVGPTRVTGLFASSTVDTDGHGTHVAGIIAGNGFKSTTVTNASGSDMPGTNAQFRGKAPLAKLVSLGFLGANDTNVFVGDSELQEAPANTNALISNNSWVNGNVNEYDLSAASFDAAVRDALPETTGPQPVLFVFAAGNDGGGDDNGGGGTADSILSPGTAKDVVTVGALEQLRDISNEVVLLDGTTNTLWEAMTDDDAQVARYSARGNVGIQTEGAYGRFKPDVVAPGTFVVSLRSTMWDTNAYYNVTNNHAQFYTRLTASTNVLTYGILTVPKNAIGVKILITGNGTKNLPIYVSKTAVPTTGSYDFFRNNSVNIPPDSGGAITGIGSLLGGKVRFAIGAGTNKQPVTYNLETDVITTNDLGNTLAVLQGLNDGMCNPPYYYRYETGTSMAAPAVAGTLALMQDFFTNTLKLKPSPVLLKALLINGARVTGSYKFAVTNAINYQGWGLPKLTNSIPAALTNTALGANRPLFFLDQSPTNTVMTGDRRTYNVTVPTAAARAQWLRVTLAWTDPPGNPAAAIKLVNDLDLVVTNLATGEVFYGNNFSQDAPPASGAADTNALPDNINNVENIYLPPALGTNYSVTVVGHAVNVNAVTLEQTNVVQDFALVVASGDGNTTNFITFAPASYTQNLAPPVTGWQPTNSVLFNQYAGANAPWLSTNAVGIGLNLGFGPTATLFVGVTNQWHFFAVTNTFAFTNANFTNAAFITFLPNTAAIPREGVYAGTTQNPTRPEADIEMYVASPAHEPLVASPAPSPFSMMNLMVLSNCVRNINEDAASIGRGGTEFVTYADSAANQIYYVAVKCEDQMAGQFGFVALFSDTPFSSVDSNGVQTVYGKLVPAIIPDGNNAHSTASYSFGLAQHQMKLRRVSVTNVVTHQNFGDLVGGLTHNSKYALLNNHDGYGLVTQTNLAYDDSGEGNTNAYRHTDAPGSLKNFAGQEGLGVWILNEVDNHQSQTGRVDNFTLRLYPHKNKNNSTSIVTVDAGAWFYDYIDVPVGYTNLLLVATNLPPTAVPPLQLYLNNDVPPDFTTFLVRTELTNGVPPGNAISYGPPLAPGRYWVGLFNPDTVSHDVLLGEFLSYAAAAAVTVDYVSTGALALRDDAVVTDAILVPTNAAIQSISVGLRVNHPRISDLVFHLVAPSGARYLLMENRGAQSTNGCGATVLVTNFVSVPASGGPAAQTNVVNTFLFSGTIPINYQMFTVPDQMTVYYGSNNFAPANFITNIFRSGAGVLTITYPPPTTNAYSTYLTIVMNATNHPAATAWNYNLGGVVTNYFYLTFTEDTNLTTTPVKFGPPPFVPVATTSVVWTDSFEAYPVGLNPAPAPLGTWSLLAGQDLIATNPPADTFLKWLGLPGGGVLSNTLPTVAGDKYQLSYALGAQPYEAFYVANIDIVTGNPGNVQQFDTNANGTVFASGLNQPSAVAVDANGNVFVSDQFANTIERYTPGGAHSTFVSAGLNVPVALAFDSAGNLLVANFASGFGDGTLVRYSPAGVPTVVATNLNGPDGLAVDPGDTIYVAEYSADDVLKITPANVITTFTSFAGGSGPWGMALDPRTNLFVALNSTPNVVKVTPAGASSVFAAPFTAPYGLAFDLNTNLYVTDSSQTIFKVGPAGGAPSLFSAVGATTYSPVGLAYFNSNPEGPNSLGWLPQTATFTALQNGTPLLLDAGTGSFLGPNAVVTNAFNFNATFDTFALTQLASDLYYQPESSLDDLLNTSAAGDWQLEVLDNRAGGAATNGATLVSWRLEFVLANTNLAPAAFGTLTGGVAKANTLVAGGGYYGYYTVPVPAAANFATNLLLSASLPVNVWSSTNFPPTVGGPGDALLLAGATGGSATLTTATLPATYYLVIQNTNSTAVTFNVKVNFDSLFSLLKFSAAKVGGSGKPSLSWAAARGARYKVQWADALPPVWHTLNSPVIKTTNGVATFTDTGTQTAPLGPQRFYRLIRVP
jgi:subtilisin-like proprotein convertase family protein